ncbi:Rieske (2Fe-2S) protein [Streptosporangium sp. NPDC006007]|uniref:Rieske (2Fe-2S) protein n=1 Tax=Streptosporangium sp. NPDC006007 TaxID=3154575 RepID=UPI0033BCE311
MTETTRRAVMLGTGGAGMAALLTACGGSAEPGAQDTSSAAPRTSQTAPAPGSGSASADSEVKPLAATADIPVGGGEVFKDDKVVVTQPKAGEFKAFTSVCTHRGCDVAGVSGGTINCPCHGSRFNIADGSVAQGPAARPLAEKPIKVEGGSITLG